jgi:hypothetical protein
VKWAALIVLTALAAGVAAFGVYHLRATSASEVRPAEWKSVVDDWSTDHRFDRPHRCVAVRDAVKRLPTHGKYFSQWPRALSVYAAKVC